MMQLPKSKTKPEPSLQKAKILLYGQPKVGKSTFCSKFPKGLFLATEAGLNYLEVAKIDITNWEDFRKFLALIVNEKHDYETIIIDTADNLFDFCRDSFYKQLGIKHASDLPFGKAYEMISLEFKKLLTFLSNKGYGIVFTSHCKTDQKSNIIPSMPTAAFKVINGMCDHIFYADTLPDNKRVMTSKFFNGKLGGDRSGKLPAVMPFDYDELVLEFNKAVTTKKENKSDKSR